MFLKVVCEKKSTFFTIPGIPGEGLAGLGVYARFCETHFSVVVRQRRKELRSGLLENSSNSLVESDIFRQEEDEICHIHVEVNKKSDMSWQGEDKVCQIFSETSKKPDIVSQEVDKVCQISSEVNEKADIVC